MKQDTIFSYDIFDTVITRRTANPHGIFALMQKILVEEETYKNISCDIRENFYELRISAERLARCFYCIHGREEITLQDIYLAMNTTGELQVEDIDVLIQLERKLELQNCIGIPKSVEEIQKHIQNHERVILISDMYLDESIIREMLVRVDKAFLDIPLYLSSVYQKTKASGTLYTLVRDFENIENETWIHTGDNECSDIRKANECGIQTRYFEDAQLMNIEKNLLKGYEADPDVQLLIGASKNARLIQQMNGVDKIGASLGGFLLVPYVLWMIKDARQKGIKTLYFVARDGYVLKKIADILIKAMSIPMQTKYFYGSRKAWRMPSKVISGLDFWELLNSSTPAFLTTLEKVAKVFELTSTELLQFLPVEQSLEQKKLSRLDVDIIFYVLEHSTEFTSYIEKKQTKNLELVKKYIDQEIPLDEHPIAFVEVGGTGYTQKCLTTIIQSERDVNVLTYFFQLYSIKQGENADFLNFIPDALYIKDAIEPLCRAPHGQTIGYQEEEQKVVPVLKTAEDEKLIECGYETYIHGLEAITDVLILYYPDLLQKPVNRKFVRRCWNYYTHVRDEEILNFIGEIPFEVTGSGHGVYAPKLQRQDIEMIWGQNHGTQKNWYYRGASIDMSLLRMEEDVRNYYEELKQNESKNVASVNNMPALARIPIERYDRNTRLVIYGAGKLGQLFYDQLNEKPLAILVKWVDKNYESLRRQGYEVDGIDSLKNVGYDKILIAVLKQETAKSIKNELMLSGIRSDQIDWISPEEFLQGDKLWNN